MMRSAAPQQREIKGVLFDKDGTLIDFERSWLMAYKAVAQDLAARVRDQDLEILELRDQILARSGWPVGSERPLAASPLTWATTTDVVQNWVTMPEFGAIDHQQLTAGILDAFADSSRFPPVPAAPLVPLMEELQDRSIRIGLATMDREAKAHSTLRELDIGHYFDFVAGADSGHGVKPEPGMVEGFCRAVGLDAANVMVVGDTHADLLMARVAGCATAVAVLSGGGTYDSLAGLADHIINDVGTLTRLL